MVHTGSYLVVDRPEQGIAVAVDSRVVDRHRVVGTEAHRGHTVVGRGDKAVGRGDKAVGTGYRSYSSDTSRTLDMTYS